MRVVLASGSPRRQYLLVSAGCDVQVMVPQVDESTKAGESAWDYVARLAQEKALAIDHQEREPIVAADTSVVLNGQVLGKPDDDAHAERMLRALSGQEHVVMTGYFVKSPSSHRQGVVQTKVCFRALSDDEIKAYVMTGEPRDKAGAYGIQGQGGALIDQIAGSYTNVIGLPLREVLVALSEVGHV